MDITKETGRTHCPGCAHEVEAFWNYCPSCGVQLNPEVQILTVQQIQALHSESESRSTGSK